MRCQLVQQKLDLLASPDLADSERQQIEGHLRSCPACQRALARQRQLQALLQTVPAPPVPKGLAERVLARAARQPSADPAPRPSPWRRAEGGRVWGRVRAGLRMAASLAAGLLIGVFLGQETWQAIDQAAAPAEPANSVAASALENLSDPGDDTLARTYLQLISTRDG